MCFQTTKIPTENERGCELPKIIDLAADEMAFRISLYVCIYRVAEMPRPSKPYSPFLGGFAGLGTRAHAKARCRADLRCLLREIAAQFSCGKYLKFRAGDF